MNTRQELIAHLKQAAKGTQYMIKETDYGFILTFNIVDEEWYTILYKNGLTRVFEIEARVNEAKKTVTTTDVSKNLEWQIGVDGVKRIPKLALHGTYSRGETLAGYSREIQWGFSKKDPAFTRVVDYTYRPIAVKKWLNAQLEQCGWKRAWGLEARIGMAFAIIGGVGAIITVVIHILRHFKVF
ncbi:MAG: hypothetical protein WAQ25_04045 [Candidatus Saccharimonas sp.]